MFQYSNSNKRYHTFDFAMKQQFGRKVIKLSINAGFTCPNIDGSRGTGGCTYCSDTGGGDFAGRLTESVTQQLKGQKELLRAKWPCASYIAYFQAHTNTYAPVDKLRLLFEEALSCKEVVGLSIATRADCLPPDILALLSELNERTWLTVELGLQTIHEKTAFAINRCHTFAEFLSAYEALQIRGISTCIHLINGLPGENANMMLESAYRVGRLHPYAIKLHLLHVLKGTRLAQQYLQGEFSLLREDEYVSIICDQLELLSPTIVIQRLTGDGNQQQLIGPLWSRDKRSVLNKIDKEMERRNAFQGDRLIDCSYKPFDNRA